MIRARIARNVTLGGVEQLEERQVMTGVTAVLLPGGLLKVTGTSNAESVSIGKWNYDQTTLVVTQQGRGEINRWNVNDVKAIDASMGDGNDFLNIDFRNLGSLKSIKIDMGRGSNEEVRVSSLSCDTLDVNAKGSINTTLRITSSTISAKAFADFGSGQGNDRVFVAGSHVESLRLSMGGGDDSVSVNRSTVGKAAINLGSGDRDNFSTIQSDIASGTVDGGVGSRDSLRGTRFRGVRFIDFEDVERS